MSAVHGSGSDLESDLRLAASVSRQYAPSGLKDVIQMGATAEGDAFVRVDKVSPAHAALMNQIYADDVREVAARLESSPAALDRFSRFSIMEVPIGWESTFEEAMAPFTDGMDMSQTYHDEGVDLVGPASNVSF
jgi:hypothetical protein